MSRLRFIRLASGWVPSSRPAGKWTCRCCAVEAEIQPVARPEIEPVFEHALADAFDVRQVALADPHERHRDSGGDRRIQHTEPGRKRGNFGRSAKATFEWSRLVGSVPV